MLVCANIDNELCLQVAGKFCMELAIKKAKEVGVAWVTCTGKEKGVCQLMIEVTMYTVHP